MIQPHISHKRWTIAWTVALLFHLIILALIAWKQMPDNLVHVSHSVPMPNQTVELMPAQGIEPAVFFSGNLDNLNHDAVLLYEIQKDGTRKLISTAHQHPKRENGLQFDAIAIPGTYEIVVLDGENGISPNFDGELTQFLPSGDGKAGGSFTMQFKLASKVHEIVTATVYEPDKPLVNEEAAFMAKQEQETKPKKNEPIVQPPPDPRPQKTKRPKPQKPIPDKPTSTLVQENSGPVQTGEPETDEPSPIKLKPEDLRLTSYNLAPELVMESALTAKLNFTERDTNTWVHSANLANQRYKAAYNPEGPVVGIGQRGNSVEQLKEVEAYLALMHGQIHPLWGYGYLIRLDTIYRNPEAPMNDPNLEAVLEITLDNMGNVSDVRVVRSSGITDYDAEAIHTAWNSSPGSAPPKEMRSDNGNSYVHWTFWRDSRQCGVFGVKVYKLNENAKDSIEFSLKAVQIEEEKLGLKPSVIPSYKDNKINKNNTNDTDNHEVQEEIQTEPTLPERINPMDD